MHELTSSSGLALRRRWGIQSMRAVLTGTFAIQSGDDQRWLRVVEGAPQIEAAESAPSDLTSSTKG